MRNALYILVKYGYHLLFIAIEFLCMYLIVNYNPTQKGIFINSTNLLVKNINSRVDKINGYLNLQRVNDSLHIQNARLFQVLINSNVNSNKSLLDTISIDSFQYELRPASICNSTVHLRNNYITLCEGEKNGIEPDMGVISDRGLVGIINKTSANYSNVVSILNKNTNLSCSIKRNGAHGNLVWNGIDPTIMNLEAIPKHILLKEGDTIITSGYSTIFPKGIIVGTTKKVLLEKGSNNYTVEVKLINDPVSFNVVYVIRNKKSKEQKQIESSNK